MPAPLDESAPELRLLPGSFRKRRWPACASLKSGRFLPTFTDERGIFGRECIVRRLRNAFHIVLAVLGWLGFAAAWYYVFWSRAVTYSGWRDVALIFLIAAVMVFVTLLWVRYNVGIYRRKGARTAVPSVIYDFSRDAQGTPVVADLGALRASRYVIVALDSSADGTPRKTYVAGSEELSDDEAAACTM